MDFLDNIYFDEYPELIATIDSQRHKILTPDVELLKANRVIELDNIQSIPNGTFVTKYKEVEFECFFYYKESAPLYVFLNGALMQNMPPQFSRWSYYTFAKGSILNISDPMYRLYSGLPLGWYYGNKEMNLRVCVAGLVQKIAHILNIPNERIVFWGSSGGGAATFECSSYIEGAKAVAINPQIVLADHHHSTTFMDITGNDVRIQDKWHRENALYFLKTSKNKRVLIINIRSDIDMQQLEHVCVEMELRVKYGINVFENLIIWLYDCECGPYHAAHSCLENYCVFFAMEALIGHFDDKIWLEKHESAYRLINEFWYVHWKSEKRLREKQIDLLMLKKCRSNNKTNVVWGSGNDAEIIDRTLMDIQHNNWYDIKFVIDNNPALEDTSWKGLPVRHPSRIFDWKELFVIVLTSNYYRDIKEELESFGLEKEKDFIYYEELYLGERSFG